MLPPRLVFVVEDDDAVRRVLLDAVRAVPGVHAVGIAEGDAALRLSAHVRADLVLLDLVLPALHGVDVAKRLRASRGWHDVPLIATSAGANLRFALRSGFDDFLAKPFEVGAVERVVRTWLPDRVARTPML